MPPPQISQNGQYYWYPVPVSSSTHHIPFNNRYPGGSNRAVGFPQAQPRPAPPGYNNPHGGTMGVYKGYRDTYELERGVYRSAFDVRYQASKRNLRRKDQEEADN